jgi:hypothetical protein
MLRKAVSGLPTIGLRDDPLNPPIAPLLLVLGVLTFMLVALASFVTAWLIDSAYRALRSVRETVFG